MAYAAKVIADSISIAECRLTTIEVTLPRIVLAEFNTHRMLSRNSASSRAIPVAKMLERVESDPFIPIYWGKNQKGMQADKELSADDRGVARSAWLAARDSAIGYAEALMATGVHKQIANRLLEPFLWHTVIATATDWSNFFALRCHPDAQPEIRMAAEMMREAMKASIPTTTAPGDWHLPFVEPAEAWDLEVNGWSETKVAKVSVGRCARVSYLTHDGKRDPEADAQLADRLMVNGHMSPYEHAAIAGDSKVTIGNFRGWVQYRKRIKNEHDFGRVLAERG